MSIFVLAFSSPAPAFEFAAALYVQTSSEVRPNHFVQKNLFISSPTLTRTHTCTYAQTQTDTRAHSHGHETQKIRDTEANRRTET